MVELLDLVEKDVLENMQKRFSDLFGFNVAFTELDSKTIGYGSAQEVDRHIIHGTTCEIVKKSPNGRLRCYESDKEAGDKAKERDSPLLYKCQCLCSNFVIPIKVGNSVIGFVYSGQFFVYLPEDKTTNEWKALQARLGISDTEWPAKQKEIIEKEKNELDEIVKEGSFYNLDEDGKYIRKNFFHSLQNLPSDKVLEDIAEKNNLMYRKEDFTRIFREKSNPDFPNNCVKDVKEVIQDIKILSTIANTISDECNTKYALKSYFEVCQEANIATKPKLVSLFYRSRKKEISQDVERLSQKILPFIKKSTELSEERVTLIDQVDDIVADVYDKILNVEALQTLWTARKLNVASFKRVEKEPLKKLLGSSGKERTDLSGLALRDRKESLKTEIDNMRVLRKRMSEMFSLSSAIGLWIGVIVIGALAIVSALKQFGVI
jgi:ligand-binding sensor protein/uncharacterized protein (UPF0335 family)